MQYSFISFMAALGLAAQGPSTHLDTSTQQPQRAPLSVTVELAPPAPVMPPFVDLRPLDGMNLGNLSALYVGVRGYAPRFARIDFTSNLLEAWNQKLSIKGVSGATKKSYKDIVTRYANGGQGRTTLPAFVSQVDQQVNALKGVIDWNAFCRKKGIPIGGCSLLHDIAYAIDGEDLVAYGMTEVLPFQDGGKNVQLMQALLPSAGSEYLNSLPALGDTMMSSGFYQFTSYAVRDDGNRVEGANVVSQFAPKPYRIPGSVAKLSGNQHHRAAFYFAVYNIARWIKASSPAEKCELRRLFASHMGEVTQFMAVAHHLPAPAIARARQWVRGKGAHPLASYLGPELRLYASKTRENKRALHKALAA